MPQTASQVSIKFGNFCESFIFMNSNKTHIFYVEIRDKGVIYLYQ